MKNKIYAYALIASGISVGLIPAFAHADAVSTTTADTVVTTFTTDIATSQGNSIVKILAVLAGLIALGWGVRKFMKWVSGRKF